MQYDRALKLPPTQKFTVIVDFFQAVLGKESARRGGRAGVDVIFAVFLFGFCFLNYHPVHPCEP